MQVGSIAPIRFGQVTKVSTLDAFQQEVLGAQQPLVAKFSSPWCEWCQTVQPDVETFSNENPQVKVVEVELTTPQPEKSTPLDNWVKQYQVWQRGLPTFSLFQQGQEKAQLICTKDVIDTLKERLKTLLST
jgi:thiol-disulfide isomerase/thioredoxin